MISSKGQDKLKQRRRIIYFMKNSYWISSTPDMSYPALENDIKVDVAIVGGGITGITCGYLLKKEGLKVAVIEAGKILHGTTGHTTAKVTSQHDLIYYKIKKQVGEELAKQYADANQAAINTIGSLVKEKNIECDFHVSSAYVYTNEDKYVKQIEDEAETASSLGIKAYYQEEAPLPFPVKAAVRFDEQARFHPLKYLLALANEIPGNGSHIFQQTRAIDIKENKYCLVITEHEKTITAEKVIIASHYPFYDGNGLYFSRLFPYRSYIIGIRIKGDFPEGMFISAEEPVRSLRPQDFDGGQIILVAGENHKTGQGKETTVHYKNLEEFAKQVFDVEEILYGWSAQDYTTADEIPYAGYLTSKTKKIFMATGFRKWGMTNSTASALIIRDLIIKEESHWREVYNPSRFTPAASAKNIIVENVNVAKQFVEGKLFKAQEDMEIEVNEGKVVDFDGQKIGIYKDEKSGLHAVDITCTHMGCELKWNSAEKTWDCPCHGSRFTYDGDIVEGPALVPLAKITLNESS
jgi:glycine/D-amino acid oxidase-like deaminating enzyme/nitrite reductase/ring-hydroxylating ferredoxin subunit